MKNLYFTLLSILTVGIAYSQCSSTVPANAVKVTQDSTIATNLGAGQVYLICEGVQLTYNGTQGATVVYHLEANARLISERQHNAEVYMKENSLINAGYSQSAWAIITNIWFHPTATLVDTMAVASNNMNECANVSYDYSLSGSCDGGGGTASLKEVSLSDVQIYPNPAQTSVNIDVASTPVHSITIINVLGGIEKQINTIQSEIVTIDLNEFKAGTYFIKIIGENGEHQTRKLIVSK